MCVHIVIFFTPWSLMWNVIVLVYNCRQWALVHGRIIIVCKLIYLILCSYTFCLDHNTLTCYRKQVWRPYRPSIDWFELWHSCWRCWHYHSWWSHHCRLVGRYSQLQGHMWTVRWKIHVYRCEFKHCMFLGHCMVCVICCSEKVCWQWCPWRNWVVWSPE